jgi:asparagine synthase (glutamine-hydrolysing)
MVPDCAEIAGMTATLQHRGPDSKGFFLNPGIAFGFRRLSIIDLESGDQPIQNEDGAVTVMCNGEIYNYIELRSRLQESGHRFRTLSDVEVIVHLYEEYGADCVRHLRGMFAFALWDRNQRRLMLARDRLGIKPLHYALRSDRIDFGSEQKALLASKRSPGHAANPQAILDLLRFGFVLGARTLTHGIERLLPGHYLLYREGHASVHQYWDLSFSDDAKHARLTSDEWADTLREKLTESVRLHMRSDVPVGAWLSSGIDSSSVVATASAITTERIQSVTLGFEDSHLDETRRHLTLDRYPGFSVDNEVVTCGAKDFARFPDALWHCEEPNPLMIPLFILAEGASRRVKVVLTGEGADEILGGYHWYKHERLLGPFSLLPQSLRRGMLACFCRLPKWNWQMSRLFLAPRPMGLERFQAIHGPAAGSLETEILSDDVRKSLREKEQQELPIPIPQDFHRWRRFEQLQYLDLKIRLPEFINHPLDRATMAFGLEARPPFLDHELVELCAQIPVSCKMRFLVEKHVLRRAMRGVLPSAIAERRKHPLGSPNARWWRAGAPEFAAEALSEARLRRTGYFNPAVVSRLLEEHRRGGATHTAHLNTVLAVQLREDLFRRQRTTP